MNYPPKRKIRKKEGKKNKSALQEENETFLKHFRMTTHQVKKKTVQNACPTQRITPLGRIQDYLLLLRTTHQSVKTTLTALSIFPPFTEYIKSSTHTTSQVEYPVSYIYPHTYIYTCTNTNTYSIRYSI